MESERERARRILEALQRLPAGVLDAAVGATGLAPNAELLVRVRGALAAPDPEGALADVLRDMPAGDPSSVSYAPLAVGRELAAAATPIRAALGELAVGRQALAAESERLLVEALATDPRLVPLLEDAIALLGDDGPFAALRSAVATLGGISDVFAAIERGDADAGRRIATLRSERDAIVAAAAGLAEVPALIARALEHARIVGDRATIARLAIASAALRDELDGWRDALVCALEARLLPEARRAANRIEAEAIAGGRLDELAAVAARIAELAGQLGERDAELAAVGDQALALAQLGLGGDARALVTRARAIADGDATREVRAQLLAGQVAEKLGDAADARIAFRKVTERARSVALEHELGWAALHLGRLEAAAGQMFRAGQDLELAQQIGRALDDRSLLALAVAARIEAAPDRHAAEAVLAQAEAINADVRDELHGRLEARWPQA